MGKGGAKTSGRHDAAGGFAAAGSSDYEALIAWLENELDRNAEPYLPPPGLHRLNRTEYANVIRDLLERYEPVVTEKWLDRAST